MLAKRCAPYGACMCVDTAYPDIQAMGVLPHVASASACLLCIVQHPLRTTEDEHYLRHELADLLVVH